MGEPPWTCSNLFPWGPTPPRPVGRPVCTLLEWLLVWNGLRLKGRLVIKFHLKTVGGRKFNSAPTKLVLSKPTICCLHSKCSQRTQDCRKNCFIDLNNKKLNVLTHTIGCWDLLGVTKVRGCFQVYVHRPARNFPSVSNSIHSLLLTEIRLIFTARQRSCGKAMSCLSGQAFCPLGEGEVPIVKGHPHTFKFAQYDVFTFYTK